jgi:hypothetical protein
MSINNVTASIVASGLVTTYRVSYSGGVKTGVLNTNTPQLTYLLSPTAANDIRTARYGMGFAFLVGLAAVPDAIHDNKGWVNDHNIPMPWSAAVLAALGLPAGYVLSAQDISDMSACNDWVDQVLRPTIAAASVPAVTPAAAQAAVTNPAAKKLLASVNADIGTFLTTI